MVNDYIDIDLWNSNFIRQYKSLDLSKESEIDIPIISVQKATIEIIDGILEDLWVKDWSSMKLKEAMWRSWFTKVISKDYWTIGIVATKWSTSTLSFSGISDYYLWWNDIWDKVMAQDLKLKELSRIPGEKLWKYKTELLLIIWINSLNRLLENGWDLRNFDIDTLATKFTPTLTKKAINELPLSLKQPSVVTVDSNSELVVQVLEASIKNGIVWWVEIVQSWASLVATNNAIIRNDQIIMPSVRDKDTWELLWEIIGEVNPESQVGRIANWVQTNIDVSLYEISKDYINTKPKEFIEEISKLMKQ